MPRRRIFKEGSVKRDNLGRFAEKAGGRAPALKKRTGKNAERRFRSSQKLRASREIENHERYLERKDLTPEQRANTQRKLAISKGKLEDAKVGIKAERAYADANRESINRKRINSNSTYERVGAKQIATAKRIKSDKARPEGKRANITKRIKANQKANEGLNSSAERQKNIDANQRLRARALAKGGRTTTVGKLKVGDVLVEPRGAKITKIEDAGLAGIRYEHDKKGGGLSRPDQKIRIIPGPLGAHSLRATGNANARKAELNRRFIAGQEAKEQTPAQKRAAEHRLKSFKQTRRGIR